MDIKRILGVLLFAGGFFVCTVLPVRAYQLDFEYSGQVYGTMEISNDASGNVLIKFHLNDNLPQTNLVTGFGFNLDTPYPSLVVNPKSSKYTDDLDSVGWTKLNNLYTLPVRTDNDTLTISAFNYGLTSSSSIGEGQSDYFTLDFRAFISESTLGAYGSGLVNLAAVNLWVGRDDCLFLVGEAPETSVVPNAPVPEPATMLLLGSGLAGLAAFGRKRFSKKGSRIIHTR